MPTLPQISGAWFPRATFALTMVSGVFATESAHAADDAVAWAAFSAKSPPVLTERYASADPLQELDVYLAVSSAGETRGPKPILMFVHGGGWSGGTREALAPHARYFAGLGWTSVNVSYRLTSLPGVTLMNAQEDVRAAFDWIRAQASQRGWDARHIVVLGESAGGQLACAMGILPPEPARWQPHSLVLINPVLDLTSLPWALTQPGLREAGAFDPTKADVHPAYAVSPLFQLRRGSPRTLLIHGRDDSVVPFAQAEAYAARAKTVGAQVELIGLEKTNHAFLLLEFGQPEAIHTTLRRIAQFLAPP
jgi:acetyl esterase